MNAIRAIHPDRHEGLWAFNRPYGKTGLTYRIIAWVVPEGDRATCERRPVMQKHITHVALDDSKRTIVAGILRPGVQEPEVRQLPNEPRHLRRFFARLQREGPVTTCYKRGRREVMKVIDKGLGSRRAVSRNSVKKGTGYLLTRNPLIS